jgi:hypothetical protein
MGLFDYKQKVGNVSSTRADIRSTPTAHICESGTKEMCGSKY